MGRIAALVLTFAACAAPPEVRTTRFAVGGMVCRSCEEGICAAVRKLDGVEACSADHAAGAAEVRHDPARAPAAAIAEAITKLGYTASPAEPPPAP
ncbi:Copper chaperone CopZ [Nannocystis exedens]|uniref:Copper chaperone CopZ n=1 Tax=Nannocystis exedens TaxID=54 RepID=A0A1I1W0L7_9BACT|nr:heavy metal-associated domain-containing protein [Nannocystis exedens]PCC72844.1 Zinc-transporting ATPase [Nannocystis exedens]SFD86450.1 Copper chaperone CopZ [Nannocystis exedens]